MRLRLFPSILISLIIFALFAGCQAQNNNLRRDSFSQGVAPHENSDQNYDNMQISIIRPKDGEYMIQVCFVVNYSIVTLRGYTEGKSRINKLVHMSQTDGLIVALRYTFYKGIDNKNKGSGGANSRESIGEKIFIKKGKDFQVVSETRIGEAFVALSNMLKRYQDGENDFSSFYDEFSRLIVRIYDYPTQYQDILTKK